MPLESEPDRDQFAACDAKRVPGIKRGASMYLATPTQEWLQAGTILHVGDTLGAWHNASILSPLLSVNPKITATPDVHGRKEPGMDGI